MADITVDLTGNNSIDKDDDPINAIPDISDETDDGVDDVNLTQAGATAVIGGAIFQDAANVGSGTGNYNTFLALQDDNEDDATSGNDSDGVETGFNAGQSGGGNAADPEDETNDEMDASKSESLLLGAIPVKIVGGVAYYEFRVDLNESNAASGDTLISLDQFKLFVGPYDLDTDPPNPVPSTSGQDDPNIDLVDTFGELNSLNLVYDMDATGNVSVLMDEANSSGSGNDDYVVLVPVTEFAGLDPATTYVYLFVQMGAAGGDTDGDGAIGDPDDDQTWTVDGGFHEWNLQKAVLIQGQKFNDLDGDGVKDANEVGLAGVTIYIDDDLDGVLEATDNNGVLDAGEQSDVTDANGFYSFGSIPIRAADYTINIREVVPAGMVPTTTLPVTVLIDNAYDAGKIIGISDVAGLLIGNTTPKFNISGTKMIDTNGDGVLQAGETTAHAGVTIFIDDDGDGVVEASDNNGALDAGELSTTTAADGSWSFTDLSSLYTGAKVRELASGDYITTIGGSGLTITGTPGNNQTGMLFANFEKFNISGTKMIDTNGDGVLQAGETTAHAGVTIFIDDDGDGVVEATDNNGALDAGELSTTTAADGSWSFNDLGVGYAGAKVRELASGDYITTIGGSGLTITGTSGADQTGLLFANFDPDPDITLKKYVSTNVVPGFADADDPQGSAAATTTTVQFKVVVTNTGNEALSDITLTDSVVHTVNGIPTSQDIVYTADGDATTLDAFNVFVDLNHNGTLDVGVEEWALFDTDGDGVIDAGAIAELSPDESFDLYYSLTSPLLGQHENTAHVDGTSAISDTLVSSEDDANYYVLQEDCVGVRTPGFWQNTKWMTFWDGVGEGWGTTPNEPSQAGSPGFADGELLYKVFLTNTNGDLVIDENDAPSKGLLIGDYNMNGITDVGEDTIFIDYNTAVKLINASSKQLADGKTGDGTYMLGRDMVATWLNYLANNQETVGECIGSVDPNDGLVSVREYLDGAIDWMQALNSDDNSNAGNEQSVFQFDTKVAPNSANWQSPIGGVPYSGSTLHSQLDLYNNTGTIFDGLDGEGNPHYTEYCCDADSHLALTVMSQLSLV